MPGVIFATKDEDGCALFQNRPKWVWYDESRTSGYWEGDDGRVLSDTDGSFTEIAEMLEMAGIKLTIGECRRIEINDLGAVKP